MADDENRHIRRGVISTLVKKLFAADRAFIIDLEIAVKDSTLIAGRTMAA
jgi:hypothetical protein